MVTLYSPDLAPTDYKAFRLLQHWLNGKEFATEDEVKKSIQDWMDSKPTGFWVKCITDLPNRWANVIVLKETIFQKIKLFMIAADIVLLNFC